jgi:hypothetical protein
MQRPLVARTLLGLSLGLGGLLGAAATASAAGTVSQVTVSDGALLAKGAAISVPITYTCEGGYATVFVQVRQRVQAGGLVTGSRQIDSFSGLAPCTGDVQSTTLTLLPDSGSTAAFKSGVALAFVSFTACDDASFTGCSFITREAVEFRLGNK